MERRGGEHFQNDASTLRDSSECELKAQCLRKLGEAVDGAAGSFMRDDLPGARKILDEVEGLMQRRLLALPGRRLLSDGRGDPA